MFSFSLRTSKEELLLDSLLLEHTKKKKTEPTVALIGTLSKLYNVHHGIFAISHSPTWQEGQANQI